MRRRLGVKRGLDFAQTADIYDNAQRAADLILAPMTEISLLPPSTPCGRAATPLSKSKRLQGNRYWELAGRRTPQ